MSQLIDQKGQTLLEAIIALSAILLILAAVAVAILTSVSNSTFIKNKNVAGKYAQQGIEYLRQAQFSNSDLAVDGDTKKLAELEGSYCFDDNNELSFGTDCIVNVDSTYKRDVVIEEDTSLCGDIADSSGPKSIRVTVTVRWTSGKCTDSDTYCHSSVLSSCFSNLPNLTTTPTL